MKKNIIISILLCISLPFVVTSCNPNNNSDKTKTVRVGISMKWFDDVFQTYLREAMEQYAKENGHIEVTVEDARNDVGNQLNQVENFIAQDMNAIILVAADPAATKVMTKKAVKAKIPIIYLVTRPTEKLPKGAYFIGSDNILAGKMQMEYLAKKMGGKGNLAIMLGDLYSDQTRDRTIGVKEVLKKYPDIHIVEEQSAKFFRDEALNLMSNWLTKGDQIDAVAANNDEMALGAILAVKNVGMKPGEDIFIGGIDATPDAINAMKKGELAVTVFQNAEKQGETAIKTAYDLFKGKEVPQIAWINFELVTLENYKEFIK